MGLPYSSLHSSDMLHIFFHMHKIFQNDFNERAGSNEGQKDVKRGLMEVMTRKGVF